jgi:hypothetical protein
VKFRGCIVGGAQGVAAIDRKMMAKLTTEGRWEAKQYAFDEKNARAGDPYGRDRRG